MTYNARLQPLTYEVPGVIKKGYQYYDDASLKFTQDQLTTNSRFDRKYEYDHVGRIIKGLSGQEARGGGATSERPYYETHSYDEFNHLTSRFVRQWSRFPSSSGGSFSNNRMSQWQYDSDGRPLSGPTGTYSYDAADTVESFGDSAPYKTDQQFDGDKLRLKSVLKSFDSQTNQWTVEKVTYYIHSTVLGGAIVSELDAQGGKEHTYVHWNGAVLAVQNILGNTQFVQWKHFDASSATYRVTNASGQIVESAEMDTIGADAGVFNSSSWPVPKSSGELQSYFSPGDMNSATECYTGGEKGEGGIPMPCVLLESMARGNAVGDVKSSGFSMGSKHAVWVEKDTTTGTSDLEHQTVTVYAGPGGEYAWVDDPGTVIEGWVQTRNPNNKGTAMTEAEIAKHRAAVEELLQDKTCKNFVEGVLSKIGEGKRKPFSGDILKIFDKVKTLNGWGWRTAADMNFDLGQGGSYVGNTSSYTAFINISRAAQIYGDSSSVGFVGRIVIHELLHVGSNAVGNFSHWDMFNAAYSVAQTLNLKLGTRKPTEKDPGGRDPYNADGFEDLLFQACQIRKVRGIK